METTEGQRLPQRQGGLQLRLLGRWRYRSAASLVRFRRRERRARCLPYLALAPRPVSRSQLCELFWDMPDDPRSELRWSLAKIRALLRAEGVAPLTSADDHVALDLSELAVDALDVPRCAGAQRRLRPSGSSSLPACLRASFSKGAISTAVRPFRPGSSRGDKPAARNAKRSFES